MALLSIQSHPGYYVGSSGLIYSSKRCEPECSALRKTTTGPDGYVRVVLSSPGKKPATKYVHRLVAEAFVPNPDNLSDVTHIDGNKQNNAASNLKWTSHRDNIAKALAPDGVWIIGGKNRKTVRQSTKQEDGTLAHKEYPSARAAALALGKEQCASNIRTACATGRTAYGSYWEYV